MLAALRNAFDYIGSKGDIELSAGVVVEEV